MNRFKLIVGKASNADIYGMSNKNEVYGTVVPNYSEGKLITEFIATSDGNITLGFAGGEKVEPTAVITFPNGLQISLAWDDTSKTYALPVPETTTYNYLKNREYDVVEFIAVGIGGQNTDPSNGDNDNGDNDNGDNDNGDGDNCENQPNMHWSKHDLIEYANAHGIDITGLHRKADILAAILGA